MCEESLSFLFAEGTFGSPREAPQKILGDCLLVIILYGPGMTRIGAVVFHEPNVRLQRKP